MKNREEELQQVFFEALSNGDRATMIKVLDKMTIQQRENIKSTLKKFNIKSDIEAKISKDFENNSNAIPSKFKSLIKAINEGSLKLVTELTTYFFTPEELIARNISIGAPIKLAVLNGKVDIVHLLLQKNSKLLSINNIMTKGDQRKEIAKGNNPANIKIDIFYKGCSDEMLKTLIEFDSTPVDLLVENNKDKAVLEIVTLNPKVLRVLIEEEKHVIFEKVLTIIKNADYKNILSNAMKGNESLLHFAHAKENFVAEIKLFELFSDVFSNNQNDKQVIHHAMTTVMVVNQFTGSHIMEFPTPPQITDNDDNSTTPLSGDNDDTIQ